MSCFVASFKTVSRIAAVLEPSFVGHRPSERGLTNLGRKLLELNEKAFLVRYEGRHWNGSIAPLYKFEAPGKASTTQTIKTLQSYLCNCEESDELRADPLFQRCKEKLYELALTTITETPAYDAASWGE